MKNNYEIRGDVTAIFVKKAGALVEVLIDTDSLSKVDSISTTWTTLPTKYIITRVAQGRGVSPIRIYLHRLIMDCPSGLTVDHIDRNPQNNTKSNLRIVTLAENQQNKGAKKDSKTQVRGVYWSKVHKKWYAEYVLRGKKHYVGMFEDIDKAEEAIKQARAKYMEFSPESLEGIEDFSLLRNKDSPNRQSKSGVKNVYWHKLMKKWLVSIAKNKKVVYRCYHERLEEASIDAEEARKKYYS